MDEPAENTTDTLIDRPLDRATEGPRGLVGAYALGGLLAALGVWLSGGAGSGPGGGPMGSERGGRGGPVEWRRALEISRSLAVNGCDGDAFTEFAALCSGLDVRSLDDPEAAQAAFRAAGIVAVPVDGSQPGAVEIQSARWEHSAGLAVDGSRSVAAITRLDTDERLVTHWVAGESVDSALAKLCVRDLLRDGPIARPWLTVFSMGSRVLDVPLHGDGRARLRWAQLEDGEIDVGSMAVGWTASGTPWPDTLILEVDVPVEPRALEDGGNLPADFVHWASRVTLEGDESVRRAVDSARASNRRVVLWPRLVVSPSGARVDQIVPSGLEALRSQLDRMAVATGRIARFAQELGVDGLVILDGSLVPIENEDSSPERAEPLDRFRRALTEQSAIFEGVRYVVARDGSMFASALEEPVWRESESRGTEIRFAWDQRLGEASARLSAAGIREIHGRAQSLAGARLGFVRVGSSATDAVLQEALRTASSPWTFILPASGDDAR